MRRPDWKYGRRYMRDAVEIGTRAVAVPVPIDMAGIVPIDMAIGSETNSTCLSENIGSVPLVYKSQSSPKSFKIL